MEPIRIQSIQRGPRFGRPFKEARDLAGHFDSMIGLIFADCIDESTKLRHVYEGCSAKCSFSQIVRPGQASDEHAKLNDRCELSGDATALRHFVRGRAS